MLQVRHDFAEGHFDGGHSDLFVFGLAQLKQPLDSSRCALAEQLLGLADGRSLGGPARWVADFSGLDGG